MPLEPACGDVAALIDEIRRRFSVDVLSFDGVAKLPHPEVSAHSFALTDPDTYQREDIDDELYLRIREWVETQGWQMSRQALPGALPERTEQHIYLASQVLVTVETAFHATRRKSLRSIMTEGLLSGTRHRINTDRWDTIGNIYITTTLGQSGDEQRRNHGTAHWWREHLARKNIHDDSDWSILAIDPEAFRDAVTYRDMWSRSGVVVAGVDAIQPRYVSVVV